MIVIPAAAISIEDSDDNNKVRSTEDDIFQYLVVHSAVASALVVATAFMYRDSPQKAPMRGAPVRHKQEQDLRDNYEQLTKNKDYLQLLVSFTLFSLSF